MKPDHNQKSRICPHDSSKAISKTAISLLLVFAWGLMSAHAQSRLTPISGAMYWDKDILNDYAVEINNQLLTTSYRFAYIAEPSFRPEYSLVGTKNTLILRKAEQKIWSIEKSRKVSINEYQLQLSPAIIDSIGQLFESAVLTSSYLCDIDGCDGTTYNFVSWPYSAECWSPDDDTNCWRLVALADSICKAVELQDSSLVKSNLKVISELHQTFKAMCNEKPSKEYPNILDDPDEEYIHFRGDHFVAYLCITSFFFIVVGIIGLIILLCGKKRRKYCWIPFLTAILLCVTLFAIAYFYMTLNSISW